MLNFRTLRSVAGLAISTAMAACLPFARAERPSAPKLLPKTTLAYVRVADSQELIDAFMQTSLGRLGRDEKIRPLVMQLYGSAAQSFSRIQKQIGLSQLDDDGTELVTDELLNIPQGEICVAIVGREKGDDALVFLMDVGQNMHIVRKLIDVGMRDAVRHGRTPRTEDVNGVTLTDFGPD